MRSPVCGSTGSLVTSSRASKTFTLTKFGSIGVSNWNVVAPLRLVGVAVSQGFAFSSVTMPPNPAQFSPSDEPIATSLASSAIRRTRGGASGAFPNGIDEYGTVVTDSTLVIFGEQDYMTHDS